MIRRIRTICLGSKIKDRRSIREVIDSFHTMDHVMIELNELELSAMKMALSHLIKIGNRQLLYFQSDSDVSITLLGYENILQLDLITYNPADDYGEVLLNRCNRIYEDAKQYYIRELIRIENSS